MTCAIIPFAKPAPLATSNRHRKNRAAGVPVAIANQASPLEASEGLIAPAARFLRWRLEVASGAGFANGMIAQVMDQKLLRQYAGAGSNNQIANFTTFTEPR